jgi:hypothetical protein
MRDDGHRKDCGCGSCRSRRAASVRCVCGHDVSAHTYEDVDLPAPCSGGRYVDDGSSSLWEPCGCKIFRPDAYVPPDEENK